MSTWILLFLRTGCCVCPRWRWPARLAAVLVGLCAAAPAGLNAGVEDRALNAAAELGDRVAADYRGAGLGVSRIGHWPQLDCVFQRLQAQATDEGLMIRSTIDPSDAPVCLYASSMGLGDSTTHLPRRGTVEVGDGVVRWIREDVVETYSVGANGVRQDFVVLRRPSGGGRLRLDLSVEGAAAETSARGARLTMKSCGRQLAYDQLKVTDATGRVLHAELCVKQADRMEIRVDDREAVYPVTIDPTFSDADWFSLGDLAGAQYYVFAVAVDSSGNVYIGGDFNVAGSVQTTNIVKWDGSTWTALGEGLAGGEVRALAVDSMDNVYATGRFEISGALVLNGIGMWNGSSWSALGTGFGGSFPNGFCLALDGSGNVYAGGQFDEAGGVTGANGIAMWNGTSWSALGNGTNSSVSAIVINGSDVYAGGSFTSVSGVSANKVAKWDGSSWSALGSGLGVVNQAVRCLAFGPGGLHAGGTFTKSDGEDVNYVARWNGTEWEEFNGGADGPVNAIAFDSNGRLHIAGFFSNVGGSVPAMNVARWNPTPGSWSALGTGTNAESAALAPDDSGGMFVGGIFTSGGDSGGRAVAHWDGSAWSALHTGFNDTVLTIVVDPSGDVYFGGAFVRAGNTLARRVVKWDGSTWSALGTGMDDEVNALLLDGMGNLYAAGEFTSAGGVSASRVAKWDGTAWTALGDGLDNEVHALAMDGAGNVYAGGAFLNSGAAPVSRIAKWNGANWSPLGTGANNLVTCLAWDEAGGTLYAGGSFTNVGGVAALRVARWNGTSWSAMGSGFSSTVNVLHMTPAGTLYAGGFFTQSGSSTRNNVARWTGASWAALGAGLGGTVYAIDSDASGNLYVGGSFFTAGGSPANNIATWNGSQWASIGSGLDRHAYALARDDMGRLLVGGFFTTAGASVSGYAAYLDVAAPEIAVFDGASTDPEDARSSGAGFWDFGDQALSVTTAPQTFTIKNEGTAALTGLAVSLDTPGNPGDFMITQPAMSSLAPGETTTFTLSFSPGALGERSCVVLINSNDENESPFYVYAYGSGFWTIEAWRQFYFGTTLNEGNAANDADPNKDGVPNLICYALGLHPWEPSAHLLPQPDPDELDEGYLCLIFDEAAGTTGVTVTAEYSETMEPMSWLPADEYGFGTSHYFCAEILPGVTRLFIRIVVILN